MNSLICEIIIVVWSLPLNVEIMKKMINGPSMHCIVKFAQVSWMRQRDWHILTVGRKAYTTDQRFRVIHREGTLDWLLEVKFVQLRDSGMYECQVKQPFIH
mgnify:CR=1 FL=1